MTPDHAKKVLAIGICRIVGIEPVDSTDGSPNWWMFSETAGKVIDDLVERGFFKPLPLSEDK